jgi:hypothetical protein
MKKISVLFSVVLLTGVFLLSSCNNSTTPSTPSKNYFPISALFNYWIYQKYQLDTTSQAAVFKLLSPFSVDSAFISNKNSTKLGKSCSEQTTINADENLTQLDYFYTAGQQLYALSDYVIPNELRNAPIALPISISNRWILLADNASSSDSWTIFDTTLSNVNYDIPNIGLAVINGDYKITGNRGTEASIEVDSSTIAKYYTAKEFKVVHTFTGTVKYSIFTFDLPYNITLHYWYVDNIGLVKYQLDPIVINLTALNFSFVSKGVVKNMIRYKLN